ncbi:hypothetical protein [Nocardia sp. NPDC052566]|uniref:hypothetical protein n=1 Tax=Nocardia sp. NPDC052566 TaxID=3364330 RepID=UPI0037C84041
MLIKDGPVLTACAAMGHLDLLFAMVDEVFGAEIARAVAARSTALRGPDTRVSTVMHRVIVVSVQPCAVSSFVQRWRYSSRRVSPHAAMRARHRAIAAL